MAVCELSHLYCFETQVKAWYFQNKTAKKPRPAWKMRLNFIALFSPQFSAQHSFEYISIQQDHFSLKWRVKSGGILDKNRISDFNKSYPISAWRTRPLKVGNSKTKMLKSGNNSFCANDRSGIFDATQECELFDRRNKGSFAAFFCSSSLLYQFSGIPWKWWYFRKKVRPLVRMQICSKGHFYDVPREP